MTRFISPKEYAERCRQDILHYISLDETYSKVGEFRETLFELQRDHKMLFNSLGLDTLSLLDSIGASSLSYQWATARHDEPLLTCERVWANLWNIHQEDIHASKNGAIPQLLTREQAAAVQEVMDTFENNLERIRSRGAHLSCSIIVTNDGEDISQAVLGYGGFRDGRESPLFKIIARHSLHPYWSQAFGSDNHCLQVIIHNGYFTEAIERWSEVRSGTVLRHLSFDSETPWEALARIRRKPIGEFLALSNELLEKERTRATVLETITSYLEP